MTDFAGQSLDKAGPSTPFQVIGLSQVPNVGDIITDTAQASSDITSNTAQAAAINQEIPNIILKADVQGSLEAILASIKDEANVVSASVGMVSDTDIQNAASTGSEIIGFNSKMPSIVAKLAEVDKVTFTNFKIIYQLFDYLKELKAKKAQTLGPKYIEVGQAQVAKVYNFSGTIVYGCVCTQGKIKKGDLINGSTVTSLKSNKQDVDEVKKDQEFGLVLSPNLDLKAGDIIIAQSQIT